MRTLYSPAQPLHVHLVRAEHTVSDARGTRTIAHDEPPSYLLHAESTRRELLALCLRGITRILSSNRQPFTLEVSAGGLILQRIEAHSLEIVQVMGDVFLRPTESPSARDTIVDNLSDTTLESTKQPEVTAMDVEEDLRHVLVWAAHQQEDRAWRQVSTAIIRRLLQEYEIPTQSKGALSQQEADCFDAVLGLVARQKLSQLLSQPARKDSFAETQQTLLRLLEAVAQQDRHCQAWAQGILDEWQSLQPVADHTVP